MSELGKRITFSVIAAPLTVVTVWLGGPAFVLLLTVAAALAANEFAGLAVASGSAPLKVHLVVLSALVPLAVHSRYLGFWAPSVTLLMLLVLEMLLVALTVRGSAGKPLEAVGVTLLGVLYTAGMLTFGYALRYHEYAVGALAGAMLVAYPLVLTWGTDIGAFVFGRWLGGRKLMPTVSPQKTVAGAVGGLVVAVLISEIFGLILLPRAAHLALPWHRALLAGAVVSAAAQVGDLVESMLKREAGVKDSSRLIPGHGGVLDRVDSLIFALPVAFAMLGWLLLPAVS